jgi:uncharacterized protein DUF3592
MLTLGHLVRQTAPWIMGISLTGFFIYCLIMLIKYWDSDSWTLTSGKVERYDKPTYMDNRAGTCFTQVRYSYEVDGREYSGAWLTPYLRNLQALNDFLAKELPVGKDVNVRYKPRKPGRSVMTDGPVPERDDALIQLNLAGDKQE